VQIVAGARMTMAPADFERLIPFVRSLIPASEMEKLDAVLGVAVPTNVTSSRAG
jgi:hypothetical protein